MMTNKKTVFIVDDDESICRALKLLLTAYGFQVSTFLSAEKYFSAIQDSEKGCLVLDLHMPELNGWEVLKRVVKTGSKRPVIIISADENGGLKEQALKGGAVGFFQKPLKDRELIDLINKTYLN